MSLSYLKVRASLNSVLIYHFWASVLLVVVSQMFFCHGAFGAELKLINRLKNQLKYDTNIIFTRKDQVEDWVYEVIPTLGVERRSETSDVKLKAKFRGQLFFKEDDLNTLDQDYSLDLTHSLTERFNFGLRAYYIEDTTTDRELLETGTLLTRNDRTHYSVAPSIQWAYSERDSLSLAVPLIWTNYDSWRYSDYSSTYVTITYTHMLSDMKTSLLLRPQFADLEFDNSDTQMFTITAGLQRQESERLEWGVLTGVNYSESTYEAYRARPINEFVYYIEKYHKNSYNLEWVVTANVRWEFNNGDVNGRFSRIVSESGYGQAVTRSRFISGINYHLTERLRLYLNGQYSRVEDQGSGRRVDYALYEIRPGLTYLVTKNVRIGVYYRYSYEDDKRISDNFDRDIFCLNIDIIDFSRLFK